MASNRIVKPKTMRGKRHLVKRENKIFENDKHAIFIRGLTDETTKQALKELVALKKPLATLYQRKNMFRPFDDPTSIEAIARKEDDSLFSFASHSRKRPRNLIFGRLFDYRILDMFEFGIEDFKSMKSFASSKGTLGSKLCMVFVGESFDTVPEMIRLKNLLIDFFRGPVVPQIRLAGLEEVIQFTAMAGKLFIRCYRILLKKSGCRVPRVELEEVGPSLDLIMRRHKMASDDLFKEAKRKPKAAKVKKVKNISRDAFGTKHGQIHMKTQDFDKLQTRKMRGLKKKREQSKEETENERATKKQKTSSTTKNINNEEEHLIDD